jgi:hypothetical protein
MSRLRVLWRCLLGSPTVAASTVPATLISLTGGMDSAYRSAPAVFSYNGTRTELYTMDTAYRGAPMSVAYNG